MLLGEPHLNPKIADAFDCYVTFPSKFAIEMLILFIKRLSTTSCMSQSLPRDACDHMCTCPHTCKSHSMSETHSIPILQQHWWSIHSPSSSFLIGPPDNNYFLNYCTLWYFQTCILKMSVFCHVFSILEAQVLHETCSSKYFIAIISA